MDWTVSYMERMVYHMSNDWKPTHHSEFAMKENSEYMREQHQEILLGK